MARINIEDSIYRDNRFIDLMVHFGSKWTAVGAIVDAWRIAQDFLSIENPRALIPLEEWKKRRACEQLIEFDLATIENDFVYIRGAEAQFDWIIQKILNGKKGGRPKLHQVDNRQDTDSLAIAKLQKPSSSFSSSFSRKNNTKAQPSGFAEIYSLFPRKEGKGRGLAIFLREIKTPYDEGLLKSAIEKYIDHCRKNRVEPKFVKQFGTFMGDWRSWLDADAGKVILRAPTTASVTETKVPDREWPTGKDQILGGMKAMDIFKSKTKQGELHEREDSETD